jgi:formate dehydrogenase subunit delta
MEINNLVGMANRIGDFFQSMPDRAEAKTDIAMHISKFWEPRMRETLIGQIHETSTAALHDIVREAVLENLQLLATKNKKLS